MKGQITIFDWLNEPKVERKSHPLIDKLEKDLDDLFGKPADQKSYGVWGHVPALGKRYQAWYCQMDGYNAEKIERLIERYKRYELEVSFMQIPNFTVIGTIDIMVSTVWITNKHEESIVHCDRTEKCINYSYGCSGRLYWCDKY